MVAFEFIWQESHTFCFLSIFFLFICAVIVKKISENPKAMSPQILKSYTHIGQNQRKVISVFFVLFSF